MKFSVAWLADHVDLRGEFSLEVDSRGRHIQKTVRPGDREGLLRLMDDLTSVGMAVEGHEIHMCGPEKLEQELVLDVDVTGNRPDCMNHQGLAREIAVKRGLPLLEPDSSFAESSLPGEPSLRVVIEDPEACPRFTARVVRGIRVGPSPDWLVRRLEAIGSRSINNVVDATNFMLWETGQPMHAYDLATIPGGELRVRRARAGETLTTLDGKERKLDPEVLVIADRERPVGLGGIMGGLDTEVTDATTDVLLEAAYFDRRRTRIAAKRLGMHTDASHRFERGADFGACDDAARRCAALIAELGGGTVEGGALDVRGPAATEPQPVAWRIAAEEIERFGGLALDDAAIVRILDGLGFAPKPVGDRADRRWEGTVPSWRAVDFEPRADRLAEGRREAWRQDVIEEVLRQVGFDRVPATLPVLGGVDAGENREHDRRDRLRDLLAGFGYAEAIHYAFGRREDDARYPRLASHGDPIALANPLSELYAVMRRSLVPNLVEAARFNANRGASGVRLFESGHLFPGGVTAEVEALALVSGGIPGAPWDRHQAADFLSLKGEVESVLAEIGAIVAFRAAELAGVAPGTGAELVTGGDVVGWIGRIAEPETPFALHAAELRLDRLPLARTRLVVEPPSRFPGVEVDLTLTHPLGLAWSELEAAIRALAVPDLAGFALVDRYRGKGVPDDAVATTIAFHYVSSERSLTQAEVNERHAALAAALEARYAVAREETR